MFMDDGMLVILYPNNYKAIMFLIREIIIMSFGYNVVHMGIIQSFISHQIAIQFSSLVKSKIVKVMFTIIANKPIKCQ